MLNISDDRAVAAAVARHARRAHRLRLEVPDLLGDERLGAAIERSACARPGVVRASADPRTGRVLIEYADAAPLFDQLEKLARSPRHRRIRTISQPIVDWHAMSITDVCARLRTSCNNGLSSASARKRIAKLGPNVIVDEASPSRL